jgi:hypothetical protein
VVAIVALLEGVLGHEPPSQPDERDQAAALRGSDIPAAGTLAGRLVYAGTPGCQLGTLDLGELSLSAQGLPAACSFAVSPDGARALVTQGTPGSELDQTLELVRLTGGGQVEMRLGPILGDAAWAPDGTRAAWCTPVGSTRVLDLAGDEIEAVSGCAPRFTPAGDLLTIVDEPEQRALYRNGTQLLAEEALAGAFDPAPSGAVHPLGVDQRQDGLLAVVTSAAPRGVLDLLAEHGIDPSTERVPGDVWRKLGLAGPYGALALSAGGSVPRLELQLWRAGRLETALSLRGASYPFANRSFGELLRFSPDGRELAIGFRGTGVPLVLLDVNTLATTLRPTVQHGFAWSPDGEYFALSTGSEVRISGALRSQPAYVLPLEVEGLAWTRRTP